MFLDSISAANDAIHTRYFSRSPLKTVSSGAGRWLILVESQNIFARFVTSAVDAGIVDVNIVG